MMRFALNCCHTLCMVDESKFLLLTLIDQPRKHLHCLKHGANLTCYSGAGPGLVQLVSINSQAIQPALPHAESCLRE